MSTETLLFILLVILVIGALPTWPYSRSWGYTPTGTLALILIVMIVFVIVNRNHSSRSVGDEIRSSTHEVGQDIKELGDDVKDSVRDTVR
jgi:hypothetical protein